MDHPSNEDTVQRPLEWGPQQVPKISCEHGKRGPMRFYSGPEAGTPQEASVFVLVEGWEFNFLCLGVFSLPETEHDD